MPNNSNDEKETPPLGLTSEQLMAFNAIQGLCKAASKTLPPDQDDLKILLDGLPTLSISEKIRLAKKLTSQNGRPVNDSEQWLEQIQIGAEFNNLYLSYKDSGKASPYEEALYDFQSTSGLSETTIQKYRKTFNKWHELGIVDEDGQIVIIQGSFP